MLEPFVHNAHTAAANFAPNAKVAQHLPVGGERISQRHRADFATGLLHKPQNGLTLLAARRERRAWF
jgi:hypothetical protein